MDARAYLDIVVEPNSFLVGIAAVAIDSRTAAWPAAGQAYLAWAPLPGQLHFQRLYRRRDAYAAMAASDNCPAPASFHWATVSTDAATAAVNSAEHRPLMSDSYLNCLIANGRLTSAMEYLVDLE